MTCLVSWIAADINGPSAIYIASDSRISWASFFRWNYAKKVYALANTPDILGYCGDVLFTSQVLAQACNIADSGTLFDLDASCEEKFSKIAEVIKCVFEDYPNSKKESFSIIHCSRDDSIRDCNYKFMCHVLSWSKKNGWQEESINIPCISDKLGAFGSGAKFYNNLYINYKPHLGGLSAGFFTTLCDVINRKLDFKTGGAPQLVGIYKNGPSKTFGVIFRGQRFLLGCKADPLSSPGAVEWRNEQFERCDPLTLTVMAGAKKQPRPAALDQADGRIEVGGFRRFVRSVVGRA